MNAEHMAIVLQDLLVRAMDRYNETHTLDPLRKMEWRNLDPVSRRLYVERCMEFLEMYNVTPKVVFPKGWAVGFSNWVHLDVAEILIETEKAFRVRLEDGSEHWLPKSHVNDASDYEQGDENCSISITEWLASQKGLE
jgi:hypothetical protein